MCTFTLEVLKKISMIKIILFVFSTLIFNVLCAQGDKLFMMSGNIMQGKITYIGEDSVKFIPKNKEKEIMLDRYRVFSVQYEEGKRQILYSQDTTQGRDYTMKEMELVVMGGQDALNNHKTMFPFALATAMGGAGGYVMNGSFLVFGVPMVAMLATSIITQPILNREAVRKAVLIKDEHYRKGYKRVLRTRRNNQAILGSFIGTAAGVVIALVSTK
jgi:hypothetical protein